MKISLITLALAPAFMATNVLASSVGLVKDTLNNKCWSISPNPLPNTPTSSSDTTIVAAKCDMSDQKQVFVYTGDGYLKHQGSGLCVDGGQDINPHVYFWTCANVNHHKWDFRGGKLHNRASADFCAYLRYGIYDTSTCSNPGSFEFATLTQAPTPNPTNPPTKAPTLAPTEAPTNDPTKAPTEAPTKAPTSPVTKTGSGSGDPHFKTFNGTKFDFHGGCDLVLLDNPGYANGTGLSIHIRTVLDSWWSYIDSAVVRIGDQMLELKGGSVGEGPHYWVNGQPGSMEHLTALIAELNVQFSGFDIHYTKVSSKQHKFRINLNKQGDAISMETFKSWVSVNVKAVKANNFLGAKGLMGAYPIGSMVARDGSTILTDPNDFGMEWQVLDREPMLFHTTEGPQHPNKCVMPSENSATTKKRRLGESLVTKEDAATACAHANEQEKENCIFDVLATNSKEMAESY